MDYVDYTLSADELDIEGLLDETWERERARVDAELEEIETGLEERDGLHQRIVDELEAKLAWYLERLELLHQRSVGHHGQRERLQNRIEAFYESLRDERRAHWRDRQNLLADRRDLRRERAELNDDLLENLL